MILNYIWLFFFFIAFAIAAGTALFSQDFTLFQKIISSIFSMSKTAFEISLGLTGVLAFWLGLLRVAERGGGIQILSRAVQPLFKKLFPNIPKDHPAFGFLTMNIAANALGLDNAATPIGLKAMKELQELNPNKEEASNDQIMFLVLNTSGLTLIPVSVMAYRLELGAANPADIFLPILLATFFSTLVGMVSVCLYQRINLLQKEIMAYIGGLFALVVGALYFLSTLPPEQMKNVSEAFSYSLLSIVVFGFLFLGFRKKQNVYQNFVEGAKEGFDVAIRIIPYLVSILVAIAVFRASGAMDVFISAVKSLFTMLSIGTQWVDALPTALMKPLSGSGARGLMVESMQTFGADSFVGRLTSTMQGATDTTFYILAVYFGSVGITKTRHAVTCGLVADFAGIISAILITYFFFA